MSDPAAPIVGLSGGSQPAGFQTVDLASLTCPARRHLLGLSSMSAGDVKHMPRSRKMARHML